MIKNKSKRVINSLLDLDLYKLTMCQLAFLFFRNIPVVFGFTNRTKTIKLTRHIKKNDLLTEFGYISGLRFRDDELDYLRNLEIMGIRIFRESFLGFLKNLQLSGLNIEDDGESYKITAQGSWPEVTLWETLILSVVNELYYRRILQKMSRAERKDLFAEGQRRLEEKIKILKKNPHIVFSEFGTRRRFSGEWQEYIVKRLAQAVPCQLAGTSNVYLAKKLGLKPIGTFAHEMFMVFSGIFHENDDDILKSHNKVLQYWKKLYKNVLLIVLTDTYGSDFFFRDMTLEQAGEWAGLRHDSGDPVEFGEKAIKFYQDKGIDPRDKIIVFSDGLDIETIVKLANHFQGRIKVTFGWGTNLTNDLGLKSLSLVVKAVKSNGHDTVKLSDNIAKAIGREVERFKIIFSYKVEFSEECKY
ncbi:nicotinate phosphoribosyltransferase [Candidatus Falkowbacteria bacterium RIFOXYB2_FULL_34_18]|uniref:Nicotinate phosphoribosyltransferase n=1 Tax=Candidatus Falkowbacteria bacterium RIFOXYD2_FULL_34_120 TaxID=1798007 RepID=A0A1F5TR27_9BACT|nr:MAG: nicotinate phosphoribosyltransferase [Candidatus Falkowbacteria bacterium RIFOXYB2_FULL_34_18]OGF29531.1 MAG: nicotinate phosphoribosyltransferase [Candidatus Falkowbacteria bacterium RIFOXYC12_FULL_34_55]OGF36859.1 MAG: nicotinate phosphoribosyltransferase [Candidatus Falkowbacteria bacterium RIFOXYC2_FULL_34_220]OGF39058.1 MAG: nicotinate phosphoribosyltransferase [Candidatus Falkowbacteria bacterium RIFOXYD12_FULL_34_57]OGF41289.1 MAG: nicotinate phosphoribosyltransferase [Candidatus